MVAATTKNRSLRNRAPSKVVDASGSVLVVLFGCVVLYVVTSWFVFGLRHPWMTETEHFLHFWQAMSWQTVDYAVARPREIPR